jgi:hypothetical protein
MGIETGLIGAGGEGGSGNELSGSIKFEEFFDKLRTFSFRTLLH